MTGAAITRADRIAFLGHSTVLIEVGGVRILADPLLRPRIGLLVRRRRPQSANALGELDAVLISHAHRDHLDLPSLRSLGRVGRVVGPRGTGGILRRAGIGDVVEVEAGDEIELSGVHVRAILAVHGGRRTPFVGAPTRAVGYLIEGSSRVYFAGDTAVFSEMSELGSPDVALLPVGGWGPTMGPGHMDPRDAAHALKLIRPRLAVPIHWGTIHVLGMGWRNPRWLTQPGTEFARAAANMAPGVEVRILEPGDSLSLADAHGGVKGP